MVSTTDVFRRADACMVGQRIRLRNCTSSPLSGSVVVVGGGGSERGSTDQNENAWNVGASNPCGRISSPEPKWNGWCFLYYQGAGRDRHNETLIGLRSLGSAFVECNGFGNCFPAAHRQSSFQSEGRECQTEFWIAYHWFNGWDLLQEISRWSLTLDSTYENHARCKIILHAYSLRTWLYLFFKIPVPNPENPRKPLCRILET